MVRQCVGADYPSEMLDDLGRAVGIQQQSCHRLQAKLSTHPGRRHYAIDSDQSLLVSLGSQTWQGRPIDSLVSGNSKAIQAASKWINQMLSSVVDRAENPMMRLSLSRNNRICVIGEPLKNYIWHASDVAMTRVALSRLKYTHSDASAKLIIEGEIGPQVCAVREVTELIAMGIRQSHETLTPEAISRLNQLGLDLNEIWMIEKEFPHARVQLTTRQPSTYLSPLSDMERIRQRVQPSKTPGKSQPSPSTWRY
jgi:hypothetical protein